MTLDREKADSAVLCFMRWYKVWDTGKFVSLQLLEQCAVEDNNFFQGIITGKES